ncbi:anoctamin-4-like isoform X2 [Apostichopus japonicus]|uniref:anoctamin-4-like isoform X2 n=1 Tax=Stichopus japonicus TaxID=307972 RepID=UPI003AB252D6
MKKKRCSDEDLRRIVHEILDNDPLIDEDLTTVHGILENDDFIDLDLTTVHESLDKKLLKNDGISSIIVRESLENKRFTYGGLSSIVCLIMKNTPHKDKDLRRIVHEILDKEQIKTLHQILDNKRCTDGDLRRIDLESLERNHFTYDDLSRIVHASLEGGKITDDILIKIAHQILENDRCTDKVLSMIVNEILKNIRNTIQAGRNITRDQNVNILDNKKVPAYPLHDGDWKVDKPYYARNDRQVLYEDWARPNNFYKKQPLHLVRNYFGERVALYFSWLGYYTIMLTFAAIFGVVTFLLACITLEYNIKVNEICDRNGTGSIIMCPSCDQDCDYSHLSSRCMYAKLTYLFDNGATIFFASFMSLWATVFCEFWKRHEKTTACEWDAIGYEETEENCRPQLERSIETTRISPVTGAEEPYVHYWVRFRRYIISFIMILFLIMLSLIAVVAIILYRISVNVALTLDKDAKNEGANTSLITTITASILSIVAILILQEFYQRIVVLLTKLELHRTETEYEDSLIFKYYLVSFFNFYSSSFYIAFVKGKLPGDPHSYGRIFGYRQEECDVSGCMQELFIHIATIMCVKQFLGNFQELGWPVIRNRIRSYRFRKTNAKNVSESEQYEKDYDLSSISSLGLLHEYLEMAIQFGFTTIFVAAFPLAPFFALLNNLIEIRLDAYKILTQCRRKYAARAEDIGSWYIILSAIGNLSVLTNALIIAFTSEFIPQTVYQTYYGEGELAGYMEFSLSVFNVSNFENGSAPVNSSFPNVTECRYRGYNTGPNLPYDHTKDYWLIIARKLLFVLFFEHIIFLIKIAMAFVIPDVPEDVRDQMKREKYLDYKVRRIKVMA